MTKLLFKENNFKKYMLYNMDDSLEYLRLANNVGYSMNIPSGFSGRIGLDNCRTEIIAIRKKLVDLKEWGNKSIKMFNNALTEMNSELITLPKSSVVSRKTVVK